MIRKSQIFAVAAFTAVGAVLAGASTLAAATLKPTPMGTSSAGDKISDAVFQKGRDAFRDIQDARFDIFDGHPERALKLMQTSKTLLGEAQSEASSHPGADLLKGQIPVDSQVTVADDYVMTPEKQGHLDKANEHLKMGERSKALEQLRLADIDVNSAILSLPAKSAERQLDEAIQFANGGKYYQANMALKALEDSVMLDMVSVDGPSKDSAGSKTMSKHSG